MSTNYGGRVRVNETGVITKTPAKLAATAVCLLGTMCAIDGGYGKAPASGIAGTAQMAGVVMDGVPLAGKEIGDNATGGNGDATVVCEDGVFDFVNHGTHTCSQTDVGKTVFASDGQTISNDSGDGPPAGELIEFNPADALPGRPCRVRLKVNR